MDDAAIRKWVDALRSGDFTQGTWTLKGPDGYCCLGVYESINGREPEMCEPDEDGELDEGDLSVYERLEDELGAHLSRRLIVMNDSGKPFSEIADHIERELLTAP